jgi:hypothetical protein
MTVNVPPVAVPDPLVGSVAAPVAAVGASGWPPSWVAGLGGLVALCGLSVWTHWRAGVWPPLPPEAAHTVGAARREARRARAALARAVARWRAGQRTGPGGHGDGDVEDVEEVTSTMWLLGSRRDPPALPEDGRPDQTGVRFARAAFLPERGFAPTRTEIDTLASQLSHLGTRLGAKLAGRALVQLEWRSDDQRRLVYLWHAPRSALALPQRLWPDQLRTVDERDLRDDAIRTGRHIARAELTLARHWADVTATGLAADAPVATIAHAFTQLDPDQGEYATVQISLLPLPAHELDLLRRNGRHLPPNLPAARRDKAQLIQTEVAFNAQVLLAAQSDDPARAAEHLDRLIACFSGFHSGTNLWARAPRSDGAEPLGRFASRIEHGRFAPARVLVLTISELTGWLTPPLGACPAPTILRVTDPDHDPAAKADSGGPPHADEVAAPPAALRRYTGQADLVPLGDVTRPNGREELVGVPAGELLFAFLGGQAGYGKTTMAVGRFLHQVLRTRWHGAPLGGFFLDPHVDAVRQLKAYLAAAGVHERVVEVNLTAPTQPGWNLFAVDDRAELPVRAGAVTGALQAAAGWTSRNAGNLLAVTNAAAHTLLEVALVVRRAGRPDLTPTLFQIPTLLSDPDWRAAVLPVLSGRWQQFWRRQHDPGANLAPITNLVGRLRDRPEIAALLGQAESTYDIRAAMDSGEIVLACPYIPGADDDLQQLLANLLTLDLLRAALARQDISNPANRRPFWITLDELHTCDRAGTVRRMLSEGRKYGLRGEVLTQFPAQLQETTWAALATNASQLVTTAVDIADARRITSRWRGVTPATIAELGVHEYLAQVTLERRKTGPFRVRSVPVERLFGQPGSDEQLAELDHAIDQRLDRRLVEEVVAELDGGDGLASHDDRLLDWLRDQHPQPVHSRDRFGERVHATDRHGVVNIEAQPPRRQRGFTVYDGHAGTAHDMPSEAR